jgi:hypothetical protein
VAGNVVLSPSNGITERITFNSMILQGTVTEAVTFPNAASEFRMIGCTTGSVSVQFGHGTVALLHDTINGSASIGRGTVAGCVITGAPSETTLTIMNQYGSASLNRVVGNVLGSGMATSSIWAVLLTTAGEFHIENNLFLLSTSPSNAHPIYLSNSLTPTSFLCSIRNNTFVQPSVQIPAVYVGEPDPAFHVDVRNNFRVGPSVSPFVDITTSTTTTTGYNLETANPAHVNGVTGQPTAGSPAINAGDPGVEYTDLDLTRNDAGCYGGSMSRDNFDDPLPTTAVVGFANVPRRTLAAANVSITIDAFDR